MVQDSCGTIKNSEEIRVFSIDKQKTNFLYPEIEITLASLFLLDEKRLKIIHTTSFLEDNAFVHLSDI